MSTVYIVLILILGGYIGHINVLKNAISSTKLERNTYWENTLKVAKQEHRETANAITQAYIESEK